MLIMPSLRPFLIYLCILISIIVKFLHLIKLQQSFLPSRLHYHSLVVLLPNMSYAPILLEDDMPYHRSCGTKIYQLVSWMLFYMPIMYHQASRTNLFLKYSPFSLGFSWALCLKLPLGYLFVGDMVWPYGALLHIWLIKSWIDDYKSVSYHHQWSTLVYQIL